ncbi:hypothetical protein CEXT_337541 [Caerostris extrusa]|uniref:Uncharacterized protein n=1 Tax=Caerostris extrusa TaxID=172846 RepID=A0AAV4QH23_CAEEX|nr:hypothetical protein CEXT_337541 [Caerostris extrusa]
MYNATNKENRTPVLQSSEFIVERRPTVDAERYRLLEAGSMSCRWSWHLVPPRIFGLHASLMTREPLSPMWNHEKKEKKAANEERSQARHKSEDAVRRILVSYKSENSESLSAIHLRQWLSASAIHHTFSLRKKLHFSQDLQMMTNVAGFFFSFRLRFDTFRTDFRDTDSKCFFFIINYGGVEVYLEKLHII